MAAFQRIACLKVSLVTNFTGHVTECFGSVNLTAKSFNFCYLQMKEVKSIAYICRR